MALMSASCCSISGTWRQPPVSCVVELTVVFLLTFGNNHLVAFIGAWIITFLGGMLTELLRYYRMHFEKQAYFCTEPVSSAISSNPDKKPKMK